MENKQISLEEELKDSENFDRIDRINRWNPEMWSKKKLMTILVGGTLLGCFAFYTLLGYCVGKNFMDKGYTPDKIEKEVKYKEVKYLPGFFKNVMKPGRELAYLLHYEEAQENGKK